MYSMVMMMAMTASPESVACHRSAGCYGGGSCQGVIVNSGCHGSRFGSCHGGGLFSGGGCSGSCHGTYSSGCYGSSCHGSSCHGGGRFGGCNGGLFRKHGHGCSGGCYGGCYGGGYGNGCSGGYGGPGTVIPIEPKKTMPMKTSAPANITVNVPADAKISIDGAPTTSTSTVRVFATPELATGAVYYYTISAAVVREGKTLVATEKVAVEAGTNVQISLTPKGQSFVSK